MRQFLHQFYFRQIKMNMLNTNLQSFIYMFYEFKVELEDELKPLRLSLGGQGLPIHCTARQKVAILVPYRNRFDNLKAFLRHMHRFLSKQLLEYGIYLIEPVDNAKFNRGLLLNIGFDLALKDNKKWQCFIFHDVDLFPEDERNLYYCPTTPTHLSTSVDIFNYRFVFILIFIFAPLLKLLSYVLIFFSLPYQDIFGGVTAFTRDQFKDINGYSNLYFGWGGEGNIFCS